MKILWHSNSPWAPTGYGQQTKLFAPRIAKHYDLAISSFYGLEGDALDWQGIRVFPGLGGEYGNACIPRHAEHYFAGDPGMVVTLLDVWVLEAAMAAGLPMTCWTPVDHDPAPPGVMGFFADSGAIPIAMSRFGRDQLAMFDPLYVPHAVDTEAYRPHDRAECRKLTGVDEDAFLVGMVAANKGRPSRKSFQEALQAFAQLRERHDNAFLYLHTTIDANFSQGEDLMALVNALQLPEGSVLVADQYRQAFRPISPEMMARVYSTFDVLLNPARGEGFGVPILEAQACGIPAIVTDFSAMAEVTGAGWRVGCVPVWTGQRSWQAVPDVEGIAKALEACYRRSDAERDEMAEQARAHALTYDVEKIMAEHMLPALAEVERRIEARKPVEVAA